MDLQDFIISKTQVECYKIKGKHGMFATITLDYSGNQGRISIASDFGNWSNYWGACGSGFKNFLVGLDIHYAAGKFGEGHWFDLDKTIAGLKEMVNEDLPCDIIHDELNEEIKQLEETSNKEEFIVCMWQCKNIMRLQDGAPDISYDISPTFKSFWTKLWPAFIQTLKLEIKD